MKSMESQYDRVTFSLPHRINVELEALKMEMQASKSELIKRAVEDFVARRKREKLEKAVAMMEEEYADGTEMNLLDSEDFL